MKQITKITELKNDTSLICIDDCGTTFTGYILEIVDVDNGIISLIVSHEETFEEDEFEIYYDEETDEIYQPIIFLI